MHASFQIRNLVGNDPLNQETVFYLQSYLASPHHCWDVERLNQALDSAQNGSLRALSALYCVPSTKDTKTHQIWGSTGRFFAFPTASPVPSDDEQLSEASFYHYRPKWFQDFVKLKGEGDQKSLAVLNEKFSNALKQEDVPPHLGDREKKELVKDVCNFYRRLARAYLKELPDRKPSQPPSIFTPFELLAPSLCGSPMNDKEEAVCRMSFRSDLPIEELCDASKWVQFLVSNVFQPLGIALSGSMLYKSENGKLTVLLCEKNFFATQHLEAFFDQLNETALFTETLGFSLCNVIDHRKETLKKLNSDPKDPKAAKHCSKALQAVKSFLENQPSNPFASKDVLKAMDFVVPQIVYSVPPLTFPSKEKNLKYSQLQKIFAPSARTVSTPSSSRKRSRSKVAEEPASADESEEAPAEEILPVKRVLHLKIDKAQWENPCLHVQRCNCGTPTRSTGDQPANVLE